MIENESRYEAGKRRNIARNKRIGGQRRFFEAEEDAQTLVDFLQGSGQFDMVCTTKDPADQAEYDRLRLEIEAHDDFDYWADLEHLEEKFGVSRKVHPLRRGMFEGEFGKVMIAMVDALDEWGGLSRKQAELVRKSLAKRRVWADEAAQRAAERHATDLKGVWVGEPKQRMDFTLSVGKVLAFEGQWGFTYINLCRDEDGNQIVYKGSICLPEGETVKLKATVKAHDTRDGVKQTLITRPKLAE